MTFRNQHQTSDGTMGCTCRTCYLFFCSSGFEIGEFGGAWVFLQLWGRGGAQDMCFFLTEIEETLGLCGMADLWDSERGSGCETRGWAVVKRSFHSPHSRVFCYNPPFDGHHNLCENPGHRFEQPTTTPRPTGRALSGFTFEFPCSKENHLVCGLVMKPGFRKHAWLVFSRPQSLCFFGGPQPVHM